MARTQQQPAQPAKVGVLYPGLASSLPSRITAFRDGLQAVGYREPDNIELVVRSAGGDPARIAPLAMELVERKVDVIVAASAPAVKAARSATTTTNAGLYRSSAARRSPGRSRRVPSSRAFR